MESTIDCIKMLVLVVTTFFTLADVGVSSVQDLHFRGSKMGTSPIYRKMKIDFAKPESYGLGSAFPMPPFESQTPLPAPSNSPAPLCIYPPYLPQPPFQGPPHTVSSPPPNPGSRSPPPASQSPLPPNPISPSPSPPKYVPLPPTYKPPVALPPPPPHKKPHYAVWCVAKPTVPDSIIQEALDYACGSGADCKSIQPNGACFQPNTMFAHASYAFNSYWQKSKRAGGTCDFGGTAMLVTTDPSFDSCQFSSN